MTGSAVLALCAAALTTLVAGIGVLYSGWAGKAAALDRSWRDQDGRVQSSWREVLTDRLRTTPVYQPLQRTLVRARLDVGLADFVAASAAALGMSSAVALVLGGPALALLAVAAEVGAFAAWVRHRNAARAELFAAQLPEIARVLGNTAAAGLSLRSALNLAVTELAEPARTELEAVAAQLRVGQSLDHALASLRARTPSREVGVLVSTLVISQRSGGDLIEALRNMAGALEARKDLRRELRTVIAGAVFTSRLVAGLGVGSLVLLNTMSPGVLGEMAQSGVGRLALLLAGALYGAGFLLVRRVTEIET